METNTTATVGVTPCAYPSQLQSMKTAYEMLLHNSILCIGAQHACPSGPELVKVFKTCSEILQFAETNQKTPMLDHHMHNLMNTNQYQHFIFIIEMACSKHHIIDDHPDTQEIHLFWQFFDFITSLATPDL